MRGHTARSLLPERSRATDHLHRTTHTWSHCLPLEVVKANTINGEQRLPGIELHQRSDHACDAICSCSRGERVLERHASLLNLQRALLGHGARHPRRKVSPVTMPLMPPLSFIKAVVAPITCASAVTVGRSALVTCSAASVTRRVASSSSSNTL